jgi:hypothetical protein
MVRRGFVWVCVLLFISATTYVLANPTGDVATVSLNGPVDPSNPFFQSLGTNGRTCVTCHDPDDGWSITPERIVAKFQASGGTDPLFRNNDGSNCEGVLTSSIDEMRDAYSLLIRRGLIRVGLDIPAGAEFTIDAVRDPNNCPAASNDMSVYRRPLPSTNLRFISEVMWDGRESTPGTTVPEHLTRQANDATRGHAQGFIDLTPAQAGQIVNFESALFTAQSRDNEAGVLTDAGARGGPAELSGQGFFTGINHPFGLNPTGGRFNRQAFNIFTAWRFLPASTDPVVQARRSIGRGQQLFNTKLFTISGVAGLNDVTFPGGIRIESFQGTCTLCHNTPNVGNHSVPAMMDLGITAPAEAAFLPVYVMRNLATGQIVETTDPGRALITGRWADLNKFKVPVLRGLAARAPYFHNGAFTSLRALVSFYNRRFSIGLTDAEITDLVAFLRSL